MRYIEWIYVCAIYIAAFKIPICLLFLFFLNYFRNYYFYIVLQHLYIVLHKIN